MKTANLKIQQAPTVWPEEAPATRPEWLELSEDYRKQGLLNESLANILNFSINSFQDFHQKPIYNATKWLFDFVVAAALITLLSPIFIAAMIAIKLTTKGPIFYSQIRIGREGRPFRIFKFCTMYSGSTRKTFFTAKNEMTGGLFKITNDPRKTPIGSMLRRWSVDELPQLFNVLIGDMSLVGPRPLTPEDTATVPEHLYVRFSAMPGITGLWQAQARGINNGRMKIELDAEYARNRSWKLDLSLLAETIPNVLTGKGAA